MRIFFVALCLLCANVVYGQTGPPPEAFFPSSVGNVWEYSDGFTTTRTHLTRDSLGRNNSRFLFFNGNSIPSYSIDSAFDVIHYPTVPQWRTLRYRLAAPPMQWYVVQTQDTAIGRPAVDARIDSVFLGTLFGVPALIKAIGFYYAQRVGGCVIDGRRYGTLVGVHENTSPVPPVSSKLYPCFPNPFNPSTTISYSLSERGRVNVSVYDILGRKVITLSDQPQDIGFHSLLFEPASLPSGVYFARFTATDANGNVRLNKVSKLLLAK